MEDEGATTEGALGEPWQVDSHSRDQVWVDDRDEDTVPLLEGEAAQLLNTDISLDWLRPWNIQG